METVLLVGSLCVALLLQTRRLDVVAEQSDDSTLLSHAIYMTCIQRPGHRVGWNNSSEFNASVLFSSNATDMTSAMTCSNNNNMYVTTRSEKFHIPRMCLVLETCPGPPNSPTARDISARNMQLVDAVVAVVKNEKWRTLVVIFDTTFDKPSLNKLIRSLSSNFVRSRLMFIRRDSGVSTILNELLKMGHVSPKHIIVFTSTQNLRALLHLVGKSDKTTLSAGKYKWIFAVTEEFRLKEINVGLQNVLFIRRMVRKDLSDCSPQKHSSVRDSVWELSTTSGAAGDESIVGHWSYHTRLEVGSKQLFPETFYDFGNITLTVVAKEASPFVVRPSHPNKRKFDGYCMDLLDELARRLNFNYRMVDAGDRVYGVPIANDDNSSTWNGLIGMIMRKEIDMALGPFTIAPEREEVVDFTVPFEMDGAAILTQSNTKTNLSKMFQIFKRFNYTVWIAMPCALAIVGIVLYFIVLCSQRNKLSQDEGNFRGDNSILRLMWDLFKSISQQGVMSYPITVSARCLLGVWCIFTIVIVASFTADLAAHLTVSTPPKGISSLQELVLESTVKPLAMDGGYIQHMLKTSRNKLFEQVWKDMENSPVIKQTPQGMEQVKTGRYAFMGDKILLEYESKRSCGRFIVTEEFMTYTGYGLVLQHKSPYKKAIDFVITKMLEGGVINKWRTQWFHQLNNCTGGGRRMTSLGLDRLGGCFVMYLVIIGISLLCLLGEIIVHALNKRSFEWNISGKTSSTRCLHNGETAPPQSGEPPI